MDNPSLLGTHYNAAIPDTLELAERAEEVAGRLGRLTHDPARFTADKPAPGERALRDGIDSSVGPLKRALK